MICQEAPNSTCHAFYQLNHFFHISHIIDSNTGLQHGSYIHVDTPEFVLMETEMEHYKMQRVN